jgi:hypothetical protein
MRRCSAPMRRDFQARSNQLLDEQMNNALQFSFSICVMNGMAKNVY